MDGSCTIATTVWFGSLHWRNPDLNKSCTGVSISVPPDLVCPPRSVCETLRVVWFRSHLSCISLSSYSYPSMTDIFDPVQGTVERKRFLDWLYTLYLCSAVLVPESNLEYSVFSICNDIDFPNFIYKRQFKKMRMCKIWNTKNTVIWKISNLCSVDIAKRKGI